MGANGARSSRPRRRPKSSRRAFYWGIGYHQPPIYYVRMDRREGDLAESAAAGAVPREGPDLHGLEANGTWSYYQNPFVGTRAAEGPARARRRCSATPTSRTRRTLIYKLQEPLEGAQQVVRRARSRPDVRPHRRARRAARRHRGLRADAVHHRRRQRPGAASTSAAGTARSSTTSRRPTSAGSARGCSASPTRSGATRSAPAAITPADRRPFHPPPEAEDRRRPGAEGLSAMRHDRAVSLFCGSRCSAASLRPAIAGGRTPSCSR